MVLFYRRNKRRLWMTAILLCIVCFVPLTFKAGKLKAVGRQQSSADYLAAPNTINAEELFKLTRWDLRGYCFNGSGISASIQAAMTSSLLHNFSLNIQPEAKRRFIDPAGGNAFYVMSPAMTWHQDR